MRDKVVEKIKAKMESPEVILKLSRTFNVLGDPTRTRIIFALSEKELCVAELVMVLGMSHSAISHQMRALRDLDLVKHRRDGKNVFYALDDDHIKILFKEGLEHVTEKI